MEIKSPQVFTFGHVGKKPDEVKTPPGLPPMSTVPVFQQKVLPQVVGGQWALSSPLGRGSFGQVFLARHVRSHSHVIAVKMEFKTQVKARSHHNPYVLREAHVLRALQGLAGFPELYGSWDINKDWCALGMSLLGPSLAELMRWFGSSGIGAQSLIIIGSQVLYRLERLHALKYLHRDVKPHNLLMGLSPASKTVYLVDFGLTKNFITQNNKHIPQQRKTGIVGTAKFASVHVHEGSESSMRDDLESLAYSLIWLGKGKLPWDSIEQNPNLDKPTRNSLIHTIKRTTPVEKLCEGLPISVANLLSYARGLVYAEVPDYALLQAIFYTEAVTKWGFPPNCLTLHWHDTCVVPPGWNSPTGFSFFP